MWACTCGVSYLYVFRDTRPEGYFSAGRERASFFERVSRLSLTPLALLLRFSPAIRLLCTAPRPGCRTEQPRKNDNLLPRLAKKELLSSLSLRSRLSRLFFRACSRFPSCPVYPYTPSLCLSLRVAECMHVVFGYSRTDQS